MELSRRGGGGGVVAAAELRHIQTGPEKRARRPSLGPYRTVNLGGGGPVPETAFEGGTRSGLPYI